MTQMMPAWAGAICVMRYIGSPSDPGCRARLGLIGVSESLHGGTYAAHGRESPAIPGRFSARMPSRAVACIMVVESKAFAIAGIACATPKNPSAPVLIVYHPSSQREREAHRYSAIIS